MSILLPWSMREPRRSGAPGVFGPTTGFSAQPSWWRPRVGWSGSPAWRSASLSASSSISSFPV